MSSLSPYHRDVSFKSHSQQNPQKPHNGTDLDQELDLISLSMADLILALKDIRRDDGQLKNSIVTGDSLAPDLADQLAGNVKAELTPLQQTVTAKADQATVSSIQAQAAADQAHTSEQQSLALANQSGQILSDIQTIKKQIDIKADQSEVTCQASKAAQQASVQAAEQAESYQMGAETAFADAQKAAETAMDAVGPSASHLQSQDNPHQVTHDQVKSDIAHWNAGKIMDKPVSTDNRKADGLQRVVVWDPAKDHYTHAVFSALAGSGLKYPMSWINEADGTILVLRDDGHGSLHWVFEPKPQHGKRSVSKFIELSDTPAVIQPGKALFGAEDTAGRFLEFRPIYDKLQIDALLIPITTTLDDFQTLLTGLQDGLDVNLIQLQTLLDQRMRQLESDVAQIQHDVAQGGLGINTDTQNLINKTQVNNYWHVWAGL